MTGYPAEELLEEIAFLAYYLHWDHDTLVNMEHRDRRAWCEHVSKINRHVNADERPAASLLDVGKFGR